MTDRIEDGGPAFPTKPGDETIGGDVIRYEGMTLRDWFAGQALAGLLAESMHDCGPEGIAHDCYLFADAMIAARKGGAE